MSVKMEFSFSYSILACGIIASSNALSVECYDTIYTPTLLLEELNRSLSDSNPYALTVVGPTGSLRMLGAGKLTCMSLSSEGEAGILIEGVSASVINGKIESCPNGVSVEGVGSHTILNSKITDFIDNGVVVSSSYNLITGSEIVGIGLTTGLAGVFINLEANYNTISNNYISASGNDGVTVDGKFTTITLNSIIDNDDDGINLRGESGGATVSGNFVTLNSNEGVQMTSNSNLISGNIVVENGLIGVLIGGSSTGNMVNNNRVNENLDDGIVILTGSIGNTIEDNTAMDNGEDDLRDSNENMLCTNMLNAWSNNDVGAGGTSNPPCLKDL
ncbi:right-handed parallel beta-helix repeat-containing protein [Microbulbifer epialgicus]|uniref:Right-handed parallel beta-helix repeat-containing protein n=1 Tax=Microbulbifer epialgicus TaxID=393907 RepID=A0ABV4P630_9GAMM